MDALITNRELENIRHDLRDLAASVKERFARIQTEAEKIEISTRQAMETAERKMNYQLQKSERKVLSAVKRKNHVLAEQIRKAQNVVYPLEKPQERYLNIFSFSQRLPDLITDLCGKIDPLAKAHQWIDI